MSDLEYTVRFRTTSEGDGAKKISEDVARTNKETAELYARMTAESEKARAAFVKQREEEKALHEQRKKQRQEELDMVRMPAHLMGPERVDEPEKKLGSTAEEATQIERVNTELEKRAVHERGIQDVLIARQRIASRLAQEEAAAASKMATEWSIAGAAIGVVAKASFNELTSLTKAMAEADPEWAKEHAFALESLVALEHPLETFWDTVTGGARKAVEELKHHQTEVGRTAEALRQLKEKEKARTDAINAGITESVYQRELQEIENQTAALNRQLRVMDSKRQALEAEAKLQDAIAIQNGADPNKVAAAAAVRNQQTQSADVEKSVEEAQRAYGEALEREQALMNKLTLAIANGQKNTEAISAQADQAKVEADRALQDLNAAKEVAENQKRAIAANTNQQLAELAQGAIAADTQKMEEIAKKLVEQVGPQSGVAAQAKTAIEQIVKDGVQPGEIQALLQQIQIMAATSKQVLDGGYQETQRLVALFGSSVDNYQRLKSQVDRLERQMGNRGVGSP